MKKEPKTGIAVLSAAASADTIECLASLTKLRCDNRRVVLVAHDEARMHVPRVLRAHPGVDVLRPGDCGPVAAVNAALRVFLEADDCEFVLVLGGETVVDPDMFARLVATAHARPDAAALGAKVLFYEMPDTVRGFGGMLDAELGLGAECCVYERDEAVAGSAREVDFVSGSAVLLRTAALAEVGLLDEDYYADFALMDWCTRARGAGRRIVVEPGARVWTKNPSAISPLQARYLEIRNRPRFMLTHYPENMPEFEPRYIEEVRRMICDDFRAGRPRFAAAAWLGFDDFCEGRFGEGRIATLVETQGIAQWHLNAYDRTMLRAAALLDKIPFRNRLLRRFRRALGEHLADFPEIAYTTMEHTG